MSRRLLFTILLLLTSPSAFAYVDPGSGMLLWQGLVAAFGAILVFVRQPWRTLKRWMRRLIGK